MALPRVKSKLKMVTLVTTELLRPYKANEVFTVPEDMARKLLNVHMADEFGQVFHTKVRLYDPTRDEHLLLSNGVLNQEEAYKLLKKLHPELADEEEDEEEIQLPETQPTTEFEQIVRSQTTEPKRGRGRPKKQ